MAESTIRAGGSAVVMINVFTGSPEDQQRLVEALQRGIAGIMQYLPGFISASLHRGLDGTKTINYVQWESREAVEASFRSPDVRAFFRDLAQIATPEPVLTEVLSVHAAAARPS